MKYSRTVLVLPLVISMSAATGTASASSSSSPREDRWNLSQGAIPIGMKGSIAVKLGSHQVMWIGAETDDAADVNRVFLYDVRTQQFHETAPVPTAKPVTALAVVGALADGSVVIAGGDVTDPTTGLVNATSMISYRYEPRTARWSRTGDLPEAQEWIFMPPALLPDGRLLIAGGRGLPELASGNAGRHAFVYDPHATSRVAALDPSTGAAIGRTIVVQGKWDYTRTRDGAISDLAEGHLFGNLIQLHDGRALMVGGRSFWALGEEGAGALPPGFTEDTSVLATQTEFFEPHSGRWLEGPTLPSVPGEDDTIANSHGGRANGVCVAALPNDTVVIAGGGTQPDGAPFGGATTLTRRSILVMAVNRNAAASTIAISPNAIPSSVDYGGLFGDGGRNQLLCYPTSRGDVLIAGGQDNFGEDLWDSYWFDPRDLDVTRAPDLVHTLALFGPIAGYPDGYQTPVMTTHEVGMRDSRLTFAHDVFVEGGGANGVDIDFVGSHQAEQFDGVRGRDNG